jgi:hypothetical protein
MWVNNLGELDMLMALPTVIILPISYFLFRDKIGWQAVLGTVPVDCRGAILFLV